MNFVANCMKSALFAVNLNRKRNLEFLHVVLEDGELKNVYGESRVCLADGLGLFAVRFPSLSQGMECGDSGITFDIFTHVSTGLFFCFFFLLFIYLQIAA